MVIASSFGIVTNPTAEEVTTCFQPFLGVAHFQRILESFRITMTIDAMTPEP